MTRLELRYNCKKYAASGSHMVLLPLGCDPRSNFRNTKKYYEIECQIILSVFIQIYYSETRCAIGNITRPKVWVCEFSLAGTAGSNRAGCMNVFVMYVCVVL